MYINDSALLIAKSTPDYSDVILDPIMATHHGLIAGATGTGKTVTLKTIAQSFSDAGVPTFVADIKGDITGVAVAQEASDKLIERLNTIGVTDYDFYGCPTRFWDVYGEEGIPVRSTVSEMGPEILSRLLSLTEIQSGVLAIAFAVADDNEWLLLDLKDLRSMLAYLAQHRKEFTVDYGNVSTQSVGAIQRALLRLEQAGGEIFFGEPALNILDWIKQDSDGKGYINVLNAVKLFHNPLMYSTFLLWMLTELYEVLPETESGSKPVGVFFFDEAHLLFDDAPKALKKKVAQIVKLIRSKGIGIFFITQNPTDIPNEVLAQLGNRIQHGLRAYTPSEQRSIKAAANSFRPNPAFDTQEVITLLGTGEALVSFLDEKGVPGIVTRAMIIAPACSMAPAPADSVNYIIQNDRLLSSYENTIDRISAYEILNEKALASQKAQAQADILRETREQEKQAASKTPARKGKTTEKTMASELTKDVLTSMSHSLGSGLARSLMGILKKSF